MSTRAVYTFKDDMGTFHVYKHCDGYPGGALHFIKAAFETGSTRANELAVSFIVANKQPYTGCELTGHYDKHGDLEYRYEITKNKGKTFFNVEKGNFVVSAFERTSAFWDKPAYALIFRGSLDKFKEFAEIY